MQSLWILNKSMNKESGKHSILPSSRLLRRKEQRRLNKLDKLLRSKVCIK